VNACFVPGTEEESFTECPPLLSPTGSALLPGTLLLNRHLWRINSATERNQQRCCSPFSPHTAAT